MDEVPGRDFRAGKNKNMKDKKLQIFVSSTFTDLLEERQAAVEAILSSGNIPAGMELFSAGDESQMTVIQRWIDESDVYLLLLGGRYGSVDKKTGKSYTQLEYEYAIEKGKPLFAIVISDKALEDKVKIKGLSHIEQKYTKELGEFREVVLSNLIKFWEDKKDIKIAIHETLSDFSYRKDLVGWIRGSNAVDTVLLAEQIAKLSNENSELRAKLRSVDTNVTALYSNLSYSELEELLKRDSLVTDAGDATVFDFLQLKGEKLFTWISPQTNEKEFFNRLAKYKLVSRHPHNPTYFKFTEDGHNFYLKSLLLSGKPKAEE